MQIVKEASEAAKLASDSEGRKLKAETERLLAVTEVTEAEVKRQLVERENQMAILAKQAELDT